MFFRNCFFCKNCDFARLCCVKHARLTLHWVVWQDGTTGCMYSTCCTGNFQTLVTVKIVPRFAPLINPPPSPPHTSFIHKYYLYRVADIITLKKVFLEKKFQTIQFQFFYLNFYETCSCRFPLEQSRLHTGYLHRGHR